jgi:hypothetical protein
MNNKLVPVVREDKNGKSTTRWVREAPSATTQSSRAIPAPNAMKSTQTPLLDGLFASTGIAKRCNVSTRAATLMERELERHASEPRRSILASHLSFVVLESSDDEVNNHALFVGSYEMNDGAPLGECIRGLSHYKGLERIRDFMTGASPRQQDQARALIYAASRLNHDWVETLGGEESEYADYSDDDFDEDGDDVFVYPEDRGDYYSGEYEPALTAIYRNDLVQLIMEKPEQTEQIVHLINNEGLSDVALIRSRVLHPEQALNQGVL